MTVDEIGHRIDGLGLWNAVYPYHWAIKPKGTVLPYFFAAVKGDRGEVKVRVLLLEGWQTFHDFVRTGVDRNFGWYSSPIEFPHFELVILADGSSALFRHDPGYLPTTADEAGRSLCERMLWEVFGVMMRIESDRKLPLRYADEKALFARVEDRRGNWTDEPLPIPDPRAHVESVTFSKTELKKAKDLPFAAGDSVELDFRLVPGLATKEKRPRCAYVLAGVDGSSGENIIWNCISVNPETGLRGMWESVPPRILGLLSARGRMPGEIKVVSGRMFRLMRPLCMEIPFRLSLHDRLPRLEAAYLAQCDPSRFVV